MQKPQVTRVLVKGQEDPLEEGMATPSTNLAGRIPCTEEPGGLQSKGLQRVRHDWSDWAIIQQLKKKSVVIFHEIYYVHT